MKIAPLRLRGRRPWKEFWCSPFFVWSKQEGPICGLTLYGSFKMCPNSLTYLLNTSIESPLFSRYPAILLPITPVPIQPILAALSTIMASGFLMCVYSVTRERPIYRIQIKCWGCGGEFPFGKRNDMDLVVFNKKYHLN